ncbi:MAG: DUF3108 domain-containing protein [Bacteroidales bacterium]|nr:DUF3108 domain-containing protein [Bacteroidales bacterium]
MMIRKLLLAVSLIAVLSAGATEIKRKPAYRSGETLECVFYFNWKFVWVKAGGAKLIIRDTIYNNRKVQYMSLLSSTNEKADAFFKMRDTLTTIFTPGDVRPLYYRKASVQGRHVYLNEVKYDYMADGRINLHQLYRRDGVLRVFRNDTCDNAVYDMMSMLAYARTFDFSGFKPGQRISYPIATGKRLENQSLIYRGITKITANDNLTYECLKISLVALDEDNNEKTIVNFFITNDDNHLPILLDLALNFGTAKARLSQRKGLLYPLVPLK